MSTTVFRAVGAYVRETDPQMFSMIAGHIGSRGLARVGAYVRDVDPDMFDEIIRGQA